MTTIRQTQSSSKQKFNIENNEDVKFQNEEDGQINSDSKTLKNMNTHIKLDKLFKYWSRPTIRDRVTETFNLNMLFKNHKNFMSQRKAITSMSKFQSKAKTIKRKFDESVSNSVQK